MQSYLELVKCHTLWAQSPQACSHFRTSCKIRGSQATNWLQIWGCYHFPLRFHTSLEQLTELRKALYIPLEFYHKGHKSGTDKRDLWGKVYASVPSGSSPSWHIRGYLQSGKQSQTLVSGGFIGSHYVAMIDWMTDHAIELSLISKPLTFPKGWADILRLKSLIL